MLAERGKIGVGIIPGALKQLAEESKLELRAGRPIDEIGCFQHFHLPADTEFADRGANRAGSENYRGVGEKRIEQ